MDAKLDQLLAGQEAILENLERLRAELGITLPKCADLEFSGSVWGRQARGLDLRRFTGSTLHFIGCINDGCSVDSFFCEFDAVNLTLRFGTTANSSLRALVDPDNAAGDDMSSVYGGCSSVARPTDLSNAPDQVADARALCRALGYSDGTVEAEGSNLCPSPFALDPDGQAWTSNFQEVPGFGRVFTCSGIK